MNAEGIAHESLDLLNPNRLSQSLECRTIPRFPQMLQKGKGFIICHGKHNNWNAIFASSMVDFRIGFTEPTVCVPISIDVTHLSDCLLLLLFDFMQ